jgi:beta-N-acetylhexosaminidase
MTGSELDAACAGLFTVGFEGLEPSAEVRGLLARGVHGAILFSRNVESAEQVAALTAALKREAGRRLLVAVDQEGGRVARLRAAHGFSELPAMRAVGLAGDDRLAFDLGALLGRELRAVGIDQDYAPVVDVDSNPANPVIGDRAFSADPAVVGRLGAALARGLQAQGVAACAKHFPGHGDTSQDSHLDLPRLPHGLTRLRQVELPPFAALSRAGVASVMTAHVVFEALDPGRPATLSAPVLRLLREECGFQGAILSDDLEMQAVSRFYPLEEAVPEAVNAGVDGLLVCRTPDVQHRDIDALRRAVEQGRVPAGRLAAARARIEALLAWAAPAPDPGAPRDVRALLRTPEALELAARVSGAPPGHGRDPTA